jgi:hypothetical protein
MGLNLKKYEFLVSLRCELIFFGKTEGYPFVFRQNLIFFKTPKNMYTVVTYNRAGIWTSLPRNWIFGQFSS